MGSTIHASRAHSSPARAPRLAVLPPSRWPITVPAELETYVFRGPGWDSHGDNATTIQSEALDQNTMA